MKMKRIIVAVLSLVMLGGAVSALSGCGKKEANIFMAQGVSGEQYYESEPVEWQRIYSTDTSLVSSSAEFEINNTAKTVILKNTLPRTVADVKAVISTLHGAASYSILTSAGVAADNLSHVVPGMKITVTAESGGVDSYTLMLANISGGANVTVSSSAPGYNAFSLTDGSLSSYWRSESDGWEKAQKIVIDLGKVYLVNGVAVNWDTHYATRYYYYNIYWSLDGQEYVKAADRSAFSPPELNTALTYLKTNDMLEERAARYVKLEITGCSTNIKYASVFEVEVFGWQMESKSFESAAYGVEVDAFKIDHKNKLIKIEWNLPNYFEREDFFRGLIFSGNSSYTLVSAAFYLAEGEVLMIEDSYGRIVSYTVCFGNCGGHRYPSELKISGASAKSEDEGFEAANVIDNDLSTRWSANKRDYTDSQLLIDMGRVQETEYIEIYFAKFGDNSRSYSYELYYSATGLLKNDFALLKSDTALTDFSGYARIETDGARIKYLKLIITGCSDSNASASVTEIKVYGYTQERDVLARVYFVSNGGYSLAPVSAAEGERLQAPDAVRLGYEFAGWYSDQELTVAFNGVVTEDTVLYAAWNRVTVKVRLQDSDGFTSYSDITAVPGESLELPIPVQDGYIFQGWFVDADVTQAYDWTYAPYSDITLYAKWEELPQKDHGLSDGTIAGFTIGGILGAGGLTTLAIFIRMLKKRRLEA